MNIRSVPRVALLVETASSYGRGLLRGIARYARQHGPWSFFLEPGGEDDRLPQRWRADGVIALFRSRAQARRLLRARVPTVDLDFTLPGLSPVGASNDEEGVAAAAAEHLQGRGLRRWAFCGWDDGTRWEERRRAAFAAAAARSGATLAAYARPRRAADRAWAREQKRLAAWLRGLPRPCGLFASNDARARHVLEAARLAGLRVPEDLAVVGVDDDETLCELSDPPLTSVALNTERLGWEGAALLDRLMRGRRPPASEIVVAPLGVVARKSSDILAMADPHVVAAARWMREHLAEPLRVADVLQAAGCSRKTLEVRFKASLGRTPHEELQRLRLERVKRLLVETDWPLKRVAAQSGFTYVENLHAAFRRAEGATPSAWRALRSGSPSPSDPAAT